MRRVVITGAGIVSSIGNDCREVVESLRAGRSGIGFVEEYAELGLRSHVAGSIAIDPAEHIDRKRLRFMGDAAAYSHIAMQQAIQQAGLEESEISNPRTGVIVGSGGASNKNFLQAVETLRTRGAKRVGPYMVPRTMGSTTTANLATAFAIKGVNYSISSACSTSAHCIGNACEQIQMGKQDVMFAGGGEEVDWTMTMLFDGMAALSSRYNDRPEAASRPYDADRDGFVISGGGGIVVLEALEHAQARGAKILAEVVGYGATSDGYDMVAPSGEGAMRCMQMAKATVDTPIDYINAHGTSTPYNDKTETEALKTVFGDHAYELNVSSTKSMTGHLLGAAGGIELVASVLAVTHNVVPPTINYEVPDPECDLNYTPNTAQERPVRIAISNTFGFGGHNASIAVSKFNK